MKYLIYMSAAVKLLNDNELKDILVKSQANNAANNLTGMLLYSHGSFVQVLEGDEQALNTTFLRIRLDTRHKGIIKLAEGDLEERMFADWSMGFRSVSSSELTQFEAYVDPSKARILAANVHPALTVLKTFAESNNL